MGQAKSTDARAMGSYMDGGTDAFPKKLFQNPLARMKSIKKGGREKRSRLPPKGRLRIPFLLSPQRRVPASLSRKFHLSFRFGFERINVVDDRLTNGLVGESCYLR